MRMSFFDKVKQSAAEAARLAQMTLEVTKLQTQISSREKEVERKQLLAGQAALDAYKAGDLKAAERVVAAQSASILALQKEVQRLQSRILSLKNEKLCPCGSHLPQHALFCSRCGHKFTGGASALPGEGGRDPL
ncbi:hypothetical protein [Paenibacillus mucilaginosus]|nr:hypothetical protein [Paenibacillus mucilaginosus]AEI43815.1 hypothetical protein KNP414_05291 [Paenibacillus mucilaginosus KNP414]MCG7212668.1 hypothetical protein [Paenibacillus mucilaginosus]WDM25313.1 hypothetical protein KCX80_22965 [Paenibacillus mucilaginosus]WFA19973.1 hypothetical protein ERY13_23415 [Paenibacillus mucilaginosus]